MKTKAVALLILVVVAISAVGYAAELVNKGAENTGNAPNAFKSAGNPPHLKPLDEPGVIDGAKNPELIPDHVAYSLLFRTISGSPDPKAKGRMRNYVRQMGLGKCLGCTGGVSAGTGTDKDIDAFIAAADEFQLRVGELDRQAIEIKRNNWPNPSPAAMAQLTRLQRRKEAIITSIVASLPNRLSAKGVEHVRLHINKRVKKHVKMKTKEGETSAPSSALLSNNGAD